MKSFFKNAFLIIALSLVILMIIGIFLYDYIPTDNTFSEANTYVTDAKTLKILAEITNDGNLNDDGENDKMILKEYTVTEADLAMYAAKKDYQKGKTDPFASSETPVKKDEGNNNNTSTNTGNWVSGEANVANRNNTNSNNSTNGNTTNNSNNNVANDGTLLNSKNSK